MIDTLIYLIDKWENEAQREATTSLRSPTQAVVVLWLKSDHSLSFQATAMVIAPGPRLG